MLSIQFFNKNALFINIIDQKKVGGFTFGGGGHIKNLINISNNFIVKIHQNMSYKQNLTHELNFLRYVNMSCFMSFRMLQL